MEKKLDFFYIGESYGGNQDWCFDHMMQLGGCGAITACDSSIYLALHHGKKSLYSGNLEKLDQDEYLYFTEEMKKYLHPRWSGIDKPELYVEGYQNFLKEHQEENLMMTIVSGEENVAKVKECIVEQIDKNLPVPILILNHQNPEMDDYIWHWFLLIGYCYQGDDPLAEGNDFQVQTVTYSEAAWVSLEALWETGYKTKGGFIKYHLL